MPCEAIHGKDARPKKLANFAKDGLCAMSEVPFYYIYGIPADTDATDAIHIERVSDRRSLHSGHVEAHRHPHLYQISLWKGGGRYLVDAVWQDLPARALTIMPPSVAHGFQIEAPADALVISAAIDFVAELKARSGSDVWTVLDGGAVLPLNDEVYARLAAMFGAVDEEYRFSTRHTRNALGCHLQLIVILVDRLLGLASPDLALSADDRLLAAFLALIDQKLPQRWTLARYVEALGTTIYLLNRASCAALGRNAIEIVRERTVTEAQRLLLFSKISASEIGFMLGFDDPAHFARFFRRRTGLSPTCWRRERIDRALDK